MKLNLSKTKELVIRGRTTLPPPEPIPTIERVSYLKHLSNTITVNHHKKSSRIFATRLMLFCAGNVVYDDVTVNRISLVNPVCSLQSAVCGLQSAVCKCHAPINHYLVDGVFFC